MNRFSIAVLAMLISGCADADQFSSPKQAGFLTNQLTFLRFDAPTATGGSFWAVPGESRSIVLRHTDNDAEFLRFEVGPNSLTDVDSVQISVQVDPSGEVMFHFSPSGLRFNSNAPALLTVNTTRTNGDIDRDGDVDLTDNVLQVQSGVYKRELPLLPWLKIPSVNLDGDKVRQARIYDFTSFGMAVD